TPAHVSRPGRALRRRRRAPQGAPLAKDGVWFSSAGTSPPGHSAHLQQVDRSLPSLVLANEPSVTGIPDNFLHRIRMRNPSASIPTDPISRRQALPLVSVATRVLAPTD